MTVKAQMILALSDALRIARGFHQWAALSYQNEPWIWLGALTHVYQNIAHSLGLAPWGSHSVNQATADHWTEIVSSYGYELNAFPPGDGGSPGGPPMSYAAPSLNPDPLGSFRPIAAAHFGLPTNATPEQWIAAAVATATQPNQPADSVLVPWMPYYSITDAQWENPPIDSSDPYADPAWCERQCWAVVAAILGEATDLGAGASLNRSAIKASDGSIPSLNRSAIKASDGSIPSANNQSKQIVLVALGTGAALALVWALMG